MAQTFFKILFSFFITLSNYLMSNFQPSRYLTPFQDIQNNLSGYLAQSFGSYSLQIRYVQFSNGLHKISVAQIYKITNQKTQGTDIPSSNSQFCSYCFVVPLRLWARGQDAFLVIRGPRVQAPLAAIVCQTTSRNSLLNYVYNYSFDSSTCKKADLRARIASIYSGVSRLSLVGFLQQKFIRQRRPIEVALLSTVKHF